MLKTVKIGTHWKTTLKEKHRKSWKDYLFDGIKIMSMKNWMRIARNEDDWHELVKKAKTHKGLGGRRRRRIICIYVVTMLIVHHSISEPSYLLVELKIIYTSTCVIRKRNIDKIAMPYAITVDQEEPFQRYVSSSDKRITQTPC